MMCTGFHNNSFSLTRCEHYNHNNHCITVISSCSIYKTVLSRCHVIELHSCTLHSTALQSGGTKHKQTNNSAQNCMIHHCHCEEEYILDTTVQFQTEMIYVINGKTYPFLMKIIKVAESLIIFTKLNSTGLGDIAIQSRVHHDPFMYRHPCTLCRVVQWILSMLLLASIAIC